MSELNKIFLEKIKDNCAKNISFVEEVAEILNINYDAAYRRIKNKTKLSLEEAIKLALHFDISMDSLYDKKLSKGKVIIKKSNNVTTLNDLEIYFNELTKKIMPLQDRDGVEIFYCAKDLPLFYFARNQIFTKFKLYAILYLQNKNISLNKIDFNTFRIPQTLQNLTAKFGEYYYNVDITEIWNSGVLDATINQILYFYELKLLNYTTAIKLCDILKSFLEELEKSTFTGRRDNNRKSKIKIFNSPLLPLNNNVVIKNKNKNILITPYLMINYYVIEDQNFINDYLTFISDHLKFSTSLTNAGVKERLLFFNPKYKQIERAKQRLGLLKQFPL